MGAKEMFSLPVMVDASLAVEKLRVAAQVRQSHLKLRERTDPETDELCKRLVGLEEFIDGRVAYLIKNHPAYGWFSKVKGVGRENIGKVVATVDIERATTISALWKYAGFSVENGASERRVKGEKLHYNSQLRSMCWRLASSLLKAKGKFYEYYLKEKDKYYQRFENRSVKIVPATSLPKKDGKRYEPEGMISEGHVHNMALRKMIKLFLSSLWLVWREAEGLPVTSPYPIDRLGHDSLIDPWRMTDKKARGRDD